MTRAVIRFCLDDAAIVELSTEHASEACARAFLKYVHNLALLVKDRDLSESPLLELPKLEKKV